MDQRTRALVEQVWSYHQLQHELVRSDAILVLCSHDTRVAERGASLLLEGWAPLLIFSGGLGAVTKAMWKDPEADRFAAIALGMGVPADRILIENRSTNTGENVSFTRQLLADRGLDPASFILVQKPYMERRTYATFRKRWPEKSIVVTSPRVSLDEYLSTYLQRPAVPGPRHKHHGRRPPAHSPVRCERVPDPAGNPGGRLGGVRGTGLGRVRLAPGPGVTCGSRRGIAPCSKMGSRGETACVRPWSLTRE